MTRSKGVNPVKPLEIFIVKSGEISMETWRFSGSLRAVFSAAASACHKAGVSSAAAPGPPSDSRVR